MRRVRSETSKRRMPGQNRSTKTGTEDTSPRRDIAWISLNSAPGDEAFPYSDKSMLDTGRCRRGV